MPERVPLEPINWRAPEGPGELDDIKAIEDWVGKDAEITVTPAADGAGPLYEIDLPEDES